MLDCVECDVLFICLLSVLDTVLRQDLVFLVHLYICPSLPGTYISCLNIAHTQYIFLKWMNESQSFFIIRTRKLRFKENMLFVQYHSASKNRVRKWTQVSVSFPLLSSEIKLKPKYFSPSLFCYWINCPQRSYNSSLHILLFWV